MLRKIFNFFLRNLKLGVIVSTIDIWLAYTPSIHYFRSYEVEGNVWFTPKHEPWGIFKCSAAITQRWVGRAKHF
jgi:hypothetical protein